MANEALGQHVGQAKNAKVLRGKSGGDHVLLRRLKRLHKGLLGNVSQAHEGSNKQVLLPYPETNLRPGGMLQPFLGQVLRLRS